MEKNVDKWYTYMSKWKIMREVHEENVTRNIVFLCSYLILLYIRDNENVVVFVVDCGLTSHSARFQLYRDGTNVQFPNFDLLSGTHAMGS